MANPSTSTTQQHKQPFPKIPDEESLCHIASQSDHNILGPGVLIGARFLLTTHLIIPDKETAKKCQAIFQSILNEDGVSLCLGFDTKKLFISSKEHNYTLITLQNEPSLQELQEKSFSIFDNRYPSIVGVSIDVLKTDLQKRGLLDIVKEILQVPKGQATKVLSFFSSIEKTYHDRDFQSCIDSILKAQKEASKAHDPLGEAHFLEKLDRSWLFQLQKVDPRITPLLQKKDALRMKFESALEKINQSSPQKKCPSCFICFSIEPDIGKWLEHTLVPDLDLAGVDPLFCFRHLKPGRDLNEFQELIRTADQVILICTPDMKKKCDERTLAVTGVAQEVRLAKERYNESKMAKTIYPMFVKGDRTQAIPSPIFEPIFGTTMTILDQSNDYQLYSYYAQAFELFAAMRGVPRSYARKLKKEFIADCEDILKDEQIESKAIEAWLASKNEQKNRLESSIATHIEQALQIKKLAVANVLNLPKPPKNFTGRKEELKELEALCKKENRVAISGLGGVGKTALALKYANDYKQDYQFIHFISAGNQGLVNRGLLDLADDLKVPEEKDITNRLHMLKIRLQREQGNFLLIFDGVDDPDTINYLKNLIPKQGKTLLLMTSRFKKEASLLESLNFSSMALHPLKPEEAIAHLLKASNDTNKEQAAILAKKLGYLPLALKHAAAFIKNTPGYDFSSYSKEFDQYGVELFEDDNLDLTHEEKTILTTWNMTLMTIEQHHRCPLAKEVLNFFSFLSSEPIPLNLAEEWFKLSSDQPKRKLDNALRHLQNYSLIQSNNKTHQIHPLVQKMTHYQLHPDERQKHFDVALKVFYEFAKELNPEDLQVRRSLVPYMSHLERIIEHLNPKKASEEELSQVFELLEKAWSYQYNDGLFKESLQIAKKRYNLCRLYFEESSVEIGYAANQLGSSLGEMGHYTEALEYQKKALEILRKALGENHLFVARNWNNVGLTLGEMGQHKDALEYLKKALEIKRKAFGEDHPDLASSWNNVGHTLGAMGHYTEALEYQKKALEILRKALGEDHPNVATSWNNVGGTLGDMGQHKDALEHLKKALEIKRKAFGEDHPSVAVSWNNVGYILGAMGQHKKALEYQKKALEIWRKALGEDHPSVATSWNNVGHTLGAMGHYTEALEYQKKALEILRKALGEDHPSVATSWNNVGLTIGKIGQHKDALEYQKKALEIKRKTLGEDHHSVATSWNNIGIALENMGQYKEALEHLTNALVIRRKTLGEDHPDVATSWDLLGLTLGETGKLKDALEHLKKALEIKRKAFGEDHPSLAANWNHVGLTLGKMGQHKEALESHKKALAISKKALDEDHAMAAHWHNVGATLRTMGQLKDAREHLMKALAISRKAFGEDHINVAKCWHHFGLTLGDMGQHIDALECHMKGLEISRKAFGEDHPNVAIFRSNLLKTIEELQTKGNTEALMNSKILKILQPMLEEKSSTPVSIEPTTIDQEIDTLIQSIESIELSEDYREEELATLSSKIQKIRSQLLDSDLEPFFLNLHHRLRSLDRAKMSEDKRKESTSSFKGVLAFATFNQFSSVKSDGTSWPEGASRASCTVNALTFLSKALHQEDVSSWLTNANPQNNKINQLIDDGREKFEVILKKRNKGLAEMTDEAKSARLELLWNYGGDALHVGEIPHIEESFFLTHVKSLDTMNLLPDTSTSTTTTQFKSLLLDVFKTMQSQALGAVLQCNGSSFGVAFHKHPEGIEISIFDSHGSFALNGHGKAYVYLTNDLEDGASFLGNLIQFDASERGFFEAKDLNQLGVTLFKPRDFTKL